MLPDEYKHSQDDNHTTGTSGPNPSAGALAPEPSRPFWERPEAVSLEHGITPHGPGNGAPGLPPFPPFPSFPANFPFFGPHLQGVRHLQGAPHLQGVPHPSGPPGPPGEHPDPPLPPPPPPAPAPPRDLLGSLGPLRNYFDDIASWTQQAVDAYTSADKHAHAHDHGRHPPHFDPRRGDRRGHHHEDGEGAEVPGHRGPGGPGGRWEPPRRGAWGPHRGRWGGRCGRRGRPHPEFIHPAMDIVSSDDAYTVTIELPGLKKDDVEIAVHERVLTVSGEFKPDTTAPAPPAPSPDPEGYPLEDTGDEEDAFINIDDNCEEKKKKKKDGVILKERRVGKFKRSIDLPSWVDAEKGIKASMADGILKIVFTKGPESKAKKVNIL